MSAINELIKEIDRLEPIPAVVNQIMNIFEDPKSSMADIAEIIKFDPILTANVLKVSNSAYFSLPRAIDSIQDAITLIGLDQVINIVLINATSENFKQEQSGYGLNEGELWNCAVSSAIIAKELAIKKAPKKQHIVFTAALIKDIGKVILDRFVNDSFNKIHKLVSEKGFCFREAEKKVIGVDHAELGGIIAKKWEFSPAMIKIIKNHHISKPEQVDIGTSIVYLADNICMMMGIGVGDDGLAYRFHKEVMEKLNITPVDLEIIIADFGESMQRVEALINVG